MHAVVIKPILPQGCSDFFRVPILASGEIPESIFRVIELGSIPGISDFGIKCCCYLPVLCHPAHEISRPAVPGGAIAAVSENFT